MSSFINRTADLAVMYPSTFGVPQSTSDTEQAPDPFAGIDESYELDATRPAVG